MKNGDRVRDMETTGSERLSQISRLELMEPEPGQWFIRMVEADSKDSRDRESGLGREWLHYSLINIHSVISVERVTMSRALF